MHKGGREYYHKWSTVENNEESELQFLQYCTCNSLQEGELQASLLRGNKADAEVLPNRASGLCG